MPVKSRPLTRRVRARPRPGRRRGFGRMQRKSAQEALGAAFVTLTLRRGIEITLFTMTILEKGWITSFNTRLLNSCLHFSDLREYCSFLEFLFVFFSVFWCFRRSSLYILPAIVMSGLYIHQSRRLLWSEWLFSQWQFIRSRSGVVSDCGRNTGVQGLFGETNNLW